MFQMNPDFVIVGARTLFDGKEGVHLTASNQVNRANVDVDWSQDIGFRDFWNVDDLRPRALLRAELRSFAVVYAVDYRTAWEHLMKMGNPDSEPGRAWRQGGEIAPPHLQLPPGT